MAVLVVLYEASGAVHRIRFDPAAAPFDRHGRPASLLDVMLGHGLWLEHACGGNAACTTCHVVVLRVAQWLERHSSGATRGELEARRVRGLPPQRLPRAASATRSRARWIPLRDG